MTDEALVQGLLAKHRAARAASAACEATARAYEGKTAQAWADHFAHGRTAGGFGAALRALGHIPDEE